MKKRNQAAKPLQVAPAKASHVLEDPDSAGFSTE